MDMRELRALEIAAKSKIVFKDGYWIVPSQSSPTGKCRVSIGAEQSCECEDFTLRREACKHVLAAKIVAARDHGGVTAPEIICDEVPKRRTYPQNWAAYNESQITEKHRLQVLLADLCAVIVEPPQEGRGRRRVPIADRLFSVCYKVYSTFSSRRFGSDLADAHEAGYLSRPLHPNKTNCFLENADLTPHLYSLLVQSSLPLKAVETTFAPDSSGFSTSKFTRWFDEKYGQEKSGRDWVKVHLICGIKTNIITAAAIYDRDTGDAPILTELVNKTAENFTVKEVPCDKGYLSVENVNAIHAVGAMPFIAPKVNTTGAAGGLFEKMFHYYLFRKDEFLTHYHQRSNVESTFSAVKRKFGDAVRSKTDVAMTNEVLAKLICFNLTRVILSQCELVQRQP
jgi:transposase